jgi:opacity protein-like surface antigen
MSVSRFARAALIGIAAASPLAAQDTTCIDCTRREPSELARRSSGSFAFVQTRPLGGLAENIGFGYGLNAAYLLRLDQKGFLSLRTDLGITQYGQESMRVPLSSTIGGRIQVKVSTDNYIVPMSIGPQLQVPTGPIRPYINGGIGAQAFFTDSHVDGSDDDHDFAHTTNQHDWTSSWVAGGGVFVPLYMKKMSVLLDLGVQYFGSGHARYLRPGSIEDLPNAQIRITSFESDTRLALVHLGVRIGL